jgi:DNA-binding Xre family transcriptional regulator
MIRVRLREAMERYERNAGERITYDLLSKRTGLSRATIEAIGSRASYNPRLSTIERLCDALGCTPAELIVYAPRGGTRPGTSRK